MYTPPAPWQIPNNVEELPPGQADAFEKLRRQLLDFLTERGYKLVMAPLLEYAGTYSEQAKYGTDNLSVSFDDIVSGDEVVIRPDITMQLARMDVHRAEENGPLRLCYAGQVLHKRPRHLLASRTPFQLGAELYGVGGEEGEVEIINLMLECVRLAGYEKVCQDLGHIGIYRALCEKAGLSAEREQKLFLAIQSKSREDIAEATAGLDKKAGAWFRALASLYGGEEVFEEAARCFRDAPAEVGQAIANTKKVAERTAEKHPETQLYVDFGELRGYRYHTGLLFSVYARGEGEALASGGRCDNIGAVFGKGRPSVGFSLDLKQLGANY